MENDDGQMHIRYMSRSNATMVKVDINGRMHVSKKWSDEAIKCILDTCLEEMQRVGKNGQSLHRKSWDQFRHFDHPMELSAEETYAAFEEKVKKTIYLDNLSNQVTKSVLETAFGQFGTVVSVQFIPTYFASSRVYAALVEMSSVKQADDIVREIGDSPFMISGMPRPVRAQKAEIEMFDDRPKTRNKKIQCQWMDPNDQKFVVAKKIKDLTKKHAAEAALLMELQLAEEEKLHNQQNENLRANYKKYELIDGAQGDGTVKQLAARYKTTLNEY